MEHAYKVGSSHYICLVCQTKYSMFGRTLEKFEEHLSSWEHKIKVRRMEALFCKHCNLQCKYPSQLKSHNETKTHKRNVEPTLKPDFNCSVCNIQCSSHKDYLRHRETKKHAKNLQPSESSSKYHCEACNLTCKFPKQYKVHLTTAKHAKNVAKTDSLVPKQIESVPAIET